VGRFNWSRHRNFYVAVLLGLVAGGIAAAIQSSVAVATGANVFFVVYLVTTLLAARKMDVPFLKTRAADEDEPAPLILLVMLGAVVASTVSLFFVVSEGEHRMPLQLVASVASVVLGWFAVHTMWAMHYAFEYYQAPLEERGRKKSGRVAAGLDFPGGESPDGTAFLYFAYVIGMTAQTSDTAITTNAMRRLVAVHGIFAFFFNTVIVAAAVNIAVALAH